MRRYRKAIVAAVATVLATGVAIFRGDDPSGIADNIELLIAAIGTFLVWLVPNNEE